MGGARLCFGGSPVAPPGERKLTSLKKFLCTQYFLNRTNKLMCIFLKPQLRSRDMRITLAGKAITCEVVVI